MGSFLSREDLQRLVNAEEIGFPTPVPTRMISNGEFQPLPQTREQKAVEERIKELADRWGRRHGLSRRAFLRTASGMAAAFVAMNDVYGSVFSVGEAEAQDLEAGAERARSLSGQFVFDAQVHFVKDASPEGSNPHNMLGLRRLAEAYLNPDLKGRAHDVEDIKFHNFLKEVFLDSDTKLAILSGAPSDLEENWFLSNDQMHRARELVNDASGSKRLFAHSVITPGQPGWVGEVERCIAEVKPDSWKGYTMGDPNGPSEYRWRLDDETLMYPVYEKMAGSGIRNVCLHKGLLPPNAEETMPGVTAFADVSDVGKAARDWPDLNFIIYHCAYNVLMPTEAHMQALEEKGEVQWVSDLARIPEEYGVSNVYAEIGSSFGLAAVMLPRFCAAMLGTLIQGMGADKVFWGTDAVWYGSPQWQIEALRRIEIPEDMQEKFGFAPLGEADGPVKRAILGLNLARHYGVDVEAVREAQAADRLTALKQAYEKEGAGRSNLAYGFISERI